MLSFTDAVKIFYSKSFNFHGRANRAEYWWSALYQAIILLGGSLFVTVTESSFFYGIYLLIILISLVPSLSISIRRLHDTDKSGFFILLSLIPYIGSIIIIILMAMRGDEEKNRFGYPTDSNDLKSSENVTLADFSEVRGKIKTFVGGDISSTTSINPTLKENNIVFCSQCGEKNNKNSNFCNNCGEKLVTPFQN